MYQTGVIKGCHIAAHSQPVGLEDAADEDEDEEEMEEPLDLTGNNVQFSHIDSLPIPLPVMYPIPYTPHLHKYALIEDVWEGEPAILSDDEECNFLGFRITPGTNEVCFSPDDLNVMDGLDEEDQEDLPLVRHATVYDGASVKAYLSNYVKKNTQNKKKKKKKKSKNKNPFHYKKKKKSKSKLKSKSKVGTKSVNENMQLVPEDLSSGLRVRNLPLCISEEADSSCEHIGLLPILSDETEHHPMHELLSASENKNTKKDIPSPLLHALPNTPSKKKRDILLASSPYKRGSNGWEDCLRPRPAQVQHYQSIVIMRKRKLSPIKNDIEKQTKTEPSDENRNPSSFQIKKSSPMSNCEIFTSCKIPQNIFPKTKELSVSLVSLDVEEKSLMISENRQNSDQGENRKFAEMGVGEIVWAKLGSTRWWPAMVIWGADCGQPPARSGQTWVFWFGDHKISELPLDKLLDFAGEFKSKYSEFGGKMFKKGVLEAIKEVAIRAEVVLPEGDINSLITWAKEGFITSSSNSRPYAPNTVKPIPETIFKHLNRIKTQYLNALQSLEYGTVSQPRFSRSEQLENKDSALKKVREGKLKIQDICISCDSDSVEISANHPLIEGGLCKHCKDDIVETMFAYGDDGTNAYCVICGQAGELLICDNNDCNRCYCSGCIEVLVAPGADKKVLETSPWLCYLCTDYDHELNGLIQKKKDWQQNVMRLFQPVRHVQLPPSLDDYKEKRPIRVLSLFDGIGTGRHVLDQLGIEVDIYYASEIDQDAINVAIVQHKTSVIHLGQIEDITDAEVAKLCPIDLVIGGSPCNDLSLVNPARKGLYDPTGTGKLFFDFFRVLKAVQLANKGRHVFWLYENVASMPQEYKVTITRFLQCEPAMIDSKYFSPQNRARYFWGNIPGLYTSLQPHLLEQNITLDSILTPCLNRRAAVEKIRTVTTRSNSLKQGKKSILPVTMNGEGDVLWVTELEQVFGFPRHYTDVGNIPLGRRQQLLGKAWSVPVIKHLFTPLKNFFKTTSQSYIPLSMSTSPASNSSAS